MCLFLEERENRHACSYVHLREEDQSHYHTIKEGKTTSSSSQHQGNSQGKWIRHKCHFSSRGKKLILISCFSALGWKSTKSVMTIAYTQKPTSRSPSGVSKRWQLMPPLTLHVHSGISQLSRFFLPCLRNSCRSESPLNYSNRPGSTKIPKDSRAIAAGCFAGNAQTQTKLSSFSQVLADSERLTAQSQVKAEHTMANSSSWYAVGEICW